MKTDERLNALCESFAGLEEAEKDYILGVSQTLAQSVSAGCAASCSAPSPVSGTYKANDSQNIPIFYKEGISL